MLRLLLSARTSQLRSHLFKFKRPFATESKQVSKNPVRRAALLVFGAGATTYSLAIYAAYNNDSIKNYVTEYVPGGDYSLEILEKGIEAWSDAFPNSQDFLDTSKAKELWLSVKKSSADTYEKLPDIIGTYNRVSTALKAPKDATAEDKIRSAKEIAKYSAELERALKPLLPEHQDATLNNRMASLVKELSAIIKELANNTPENAPPTLLKARSCLMALLNNINIIQEDKESAIQKATKVEKDNFKQLFESKMLEKTQSHTAEIAAIQQETESRWKSDFDLREKEYEAKTIEKLKQCTEEFALQLQEELAKQSKDLEIRYRKNISAEIDKERSQRLARLEVLMMKIKSLETLTSHNNSLISRSLAIHQLTSFVDIIEANLNEGYKKPFFRELIAVKQLSRYFPLLSEIARSIPEEAAMEGIDSVDALKCSFNCLAKEIEKVALFPANGGIISYLVSWGLSNFLFKPVAPIEGKDTHSVLSRVRYFLEHNNLDSATRELNQLEGWARILAQDWIVSARKHLELTQAFEVSL
jgi:mitofilin